MPVITFIDHQNNVHKVEAKSGNTIMQTALNNQIEGIVAECGGSCSCGTCHCYVDEQWLDKMPEVSSVESETLECAVGVKSNSRLSCQITVTDDMDGLVIRLPETQL